MVLPCKEYLLNTERKFVFPVPAPREERRQQRVNGNRVLLVIRLRHIRLYRTRLEEVTKETSIKKERRV